MLQLKKIKKTYKTGDFVQDALKDVSIDFTNNEFVAILGPSGSGKTTMLNIIGGLDRYTSGDLIINNKSTKNFKDSNWDFYRNNSIGFVFQSYNLISHISILSNIELSLTLSGVSKEERVKKSLEVLEKVGLLEHKYKKPNQLSGGQAQRVAIARALVNDPDIILADEPTGALDSKTSVQIMELIKEISKEKLVIMVTHNADIAKKYANRVIKLKDGKVESDSKVPKKKKTNESYELKKTSMNFFTALKLSFNNIKTKLGRTSLISIASSIGIIGIAVIMSLSNGFQLQIDEFESKTLSSMPILINKTSMDMVMISPHKDDNLKLFPNKEVVFKKENVFEDNIKINTITTEYVSYLKNIDESLIDGFSFDYKTDINLINKEEGNYNLVNNDVLNIFPTSTPGGLMDKTYSILKGDVYSKPGLILMVDSKNRVDEEILDALNIKDEDISFDYLMSKRFKLVFNDDLYTKFYDNYILNTNYKDLYNKDFTEVGIVAIVRINKEREDLSNFSMSGLFYNESLMDFVISNNKDSKIVKDQLKFDRHVLTNEPFLESKINNPMRAFSNPLSKDDVLSKLGYITVPSEIQIYPKDFESKDKVIDYLDKYNEDHDEIFYLDQASLITSLSSNIMGAITIVLVAFSSIALIVSSIMIGIITYISVIERTKEIGILRALGARKKDISRVFNAETFIIGITSGLFGVIITYILLLPINIILENLTELKNVAKLNPVHVVVLLVVSITLTLIGGYIPSKMASKKDPVEALRTE